MQPNEIQAYCLSKPHAVEEHPFGDIPICYKLNSKIFAQLYPLEHDYKITLKCTREAGEFFRSAYPGQVVRGYHCPPVQQPYWNTIYLTDFPEEELWNMIDLAYETVFQSFPKKTQMSLTFLASRQKQKEEKEQKIQEEKRMGNVKYYHVGDRIPNYIFTTDKAIPILTGVSLHPMFFHPRNLDQEQEIIQKLANENHIFLNLEPQTTFDFYAVPHVEVFATDNEGGYLVSQENGFSFDSKSPVYYISCDRQCYLAANSGQELLEKGINWKNSLIADSETIENFSSRDEAEKKYPIHDFKFNEK